MRLSMALTALVLLTQAVGRAQEADPRTSDLASIVEAAGKVASGRRMTASASVPGGEKCGLWLSIAVREHWDAFTDRQRVSLQAFLAPPAKQKISLAGMFRVHYDTSGPGAAALLDANNFPIANSADAYADSVGWYFNDVFDREVGSLGYDSPMLPGQDHYDVYVSDIGYYGLTQTVSPIGGFMPPRYSTYIEIDNDFRQFFSKGMDGLKVTAAHEFHHAIQLTQYGLWGTDSYFLELTSTWMEDLLYDDVNDYYQYLKDPFSIPRGQFATPEVSFTRTNGLIEYSRAVWGKFVEQRYSPDVMRRAWEEVRETPAFSALDRALAETQSSLRQAFLEWTIWNSLTGASADTVASYREGASYPSIRLRPMVEFMPPARSIQDSVQAFSSVYRQVLVNGNLMVAVVSNVNPSLPAGQLPFVYEMVETGDAPFKQLANGIAVRIAVPDPEFWTSQENVPTLVYEPLVYPNPFIRGRSASITFRLPFVRDAVATLSVLSSGFDRIFSGEVPVVQLRPLEQSIVWDVKDDARRSVPSGVYVFIIAVDGREYKGKLTVIGG